jgi:hypothetical protein
MHSMCHKAGVIGHLVRAKTAGDLAADCLSCMSCTVSESLWQVVAHGWSFEVEVPVHARAVLGQSISTSVGRAN